jgi:hypothetical protein
VKVLPEPVAIWMSARGLASRSEVSRLVMAGDLAIAQARGVERVYGVASDLLRVLVLIAQSTTCQLLWVAPATRCRVLGFPVRAKTAPLVQPVSSISDSFATQRVCRNPIWLPRENVE